MKSLKALAASAATLGMSTVVWAQAQGTLPTAIDTAFANFQAQAVALLEKGWPLLIAIFGGMVLMKLFKKVGNKAT